MASEHKTSVQAFFNIDLNHSGSYAPVCSGWYLFVSSRRSRWSSSSLDWQLWRLSQPNRSKARGKLHLARLRQSQHIYPIGQHREEATLKSSHECYYVQAPDTATMCKSYLQGHLQSSVDDNVQCPLGEDLCVSGRALKLVTGYISSDEQLGINAQAANRI